MARARLHRSSPGIAAHPEPQVDRCDVADHVDHIAQVAGHDHVGIGGDYDGIGGTGPVGMKGVDGYPLLFAELARRGWSDADLAKLSSGNVLRVMERVEAVRAAVSDGAVQPPSRRRSAALRFRRPGPVVVRARPGGAAARARPAAAP